MKRHLTARVGAGILAVAALAAHAAGADAPPLRIVCFGDSITGDTPRQAYLDKYMKWSDLLHLAAQARAGKAVRVEVLNRGLAGDTTYEKPGPRGYGALKRLQRDVLDEKPDIVVILISGNDKKDTPEQKDITRKNLESIVTACAEAKIKVLLLQYAVIGPGGNAAPAAPAPASAPADKTWYHLAGNNALIDELAKKHNVPTLALQPAFDAALKTHPRKELVNEIDGVHLAPFGEITLAGAVLEKLVDLGWVK